MHIAVTRDWRGCARLTSYYTSVYILKSHVPVNQQGEIPIVSKGNT